MKSNVFKKAKSSWEDHRSQFLNMNTYRILSNSNIMSKKGDELCTRRQLLNVYNAGAIYDVNYLIGYHRGLTKKFNNILDV